MQQQGSSTLTCCRKLALIIGNNDYEHLKKLSQSINDAELMQNTLQNLGFTTFLHKNLKNNDMKHKIQDFGTDMIEPGDIIFFYYSGHAGQQSSRNNIDNFLFGIDAEEVDQKLDDQNNNNINNSFGRKIIQGDSVEQKNQQFVGQNNQEIKLLSGVSMNKVVYRAFFQRCIYLIVLDACRVNPTEEQIFKAEVNSSTTFLDEYQELEKSDEHLRQLVREVISEGFGDVDKDKINFVAFYDAVTTLKFHSKSLPQSFLDLCSKKFKGGFDELISLVEKWATEKLVVAISPAMEEVHHKDIMRLSMGLLIWNMVQKMEKVAHGNTSQNEIISKMYLYSGHDTTITPLLMALGQEVQNWPPYVSNIVFELWEKNAQYYVTALFNGNVIVTTNGGGIGGCRIELIPLDEFKRDVIGSYVLTEEEHENECAVVFTHDQSLPKQTPAQQQHQSTIVKN